MKYRGLVDRFPDVMCRCGG